MLTSSSVLWFLQGTQTQTNILHEDVTKHKKPTQAII